MPLFSLSPTQIAGGQIALSAILSLIGFFLLLPRPRGRSVAGGIAALIAAGAVFAACLQWSYGNPMPDLIGSVLFWLFSAGALVFGSVLVVQRNPARGAIAFAFVILSTCGLFLLLAAPFLMAATIIIYAGAIIVTFLFVLMLSQPKGESNENDRSRERLLGSLAGFAFVGLVLFTLYLTYLGKIETNVNTNGARTASTLQRLPEPVLTPVERGELAEAIDKLNKADEQLSGDLKTGNAARLEYFDGIKKTLIKVVGVSRRNQIGPRDDDGSLSVRLEKYTGKVGAGASLYREDLQTRSVFKRAETIRNLNEMVSQQLEDFLVGKNGHLPTIKTNLQQLRDEVVLLSGSAELPARNVSNLGFMLYSEYLLSIELAGTLLLVATIGAVAIAQRKGVQA